MEWEVGYHEVKSKIIDWEETHRLGEKYLRIVHFHDRYKETVNRGYDYCIYSSDCLKSLLGEIEVSSYIHREELVPYMYFTNSLFFALETIENIKERVEELG